MSKEKIKIETQLTIPKHKIQDERLGQLIYNALRNHWSKRNCKEWKVLDNNKMRKDEYSDIDEIIMEKQEKLTKAWEKELEGFCKEWKALDNNKMKLVTNKPQFHLIRELIRRLLKENIQSKGQIKL